MNKFVGKWKLLALEMMFFWGWDECLSSRGSGLFNYGFFNLRCVLMGTSCRIVV